ncbi:MAG: hypothetical protein JSV49_03855 [Thermoplasmata archaeon]|nr:MAG: hypothetical protein JSV49_03855 [Thermoplasmata archaeon]
MPYCENCGSFTEEDYCYQCGHQYQPQQPASFILVDESMVVEYCPNCREMIRGKFCRNCGTAGSAFKFEPEPESEPTPTLKRKEKFKGLIIADIGIMMGVIGLIFAGILFGPFAILCGWIAIKRNAKVRGRIALGLGVIDIFVPIILLLIFGSLGLISF